MGFYNLDDNQKINIETKSRDNIAGTLHQLITDKIAEKTEDDNLKRNFKPGMDKLNHQKTA